MTPFAELRLDTPRLVLRPLHADDADDVFTVFSDARVMRYWSSGPWTDRAQAVRLIDADREAHAGRRDLRLGLVWRESGRVVGTVSLYKIDAACRRADIGYALAHGQQGRGVMAEALAAVIAAAFDHRRDAPLSDLLLNRLEADVDPRNAPSCRALERLGFRLEGVLRERWQVDGEISDSAMFGLLRADWLAREGMPASAATSEWRVERLDETALADWLALRQALWPSCPPDEQQREIADMLATPARQASFVARDRHGQAVGLAELALRHDYVNGTDASPAGFLEGLFVQPDARRQGVARALLAEARRWVREQGVHELASDVPLANGVSLAVHRALGFVETERVAFFKMPA
jgi:[ribosomal protein S5]-alanine N-acetyltransferase